MSEPINKYYCKHCNASFSKRQNEYRHRLKACQMNPDNLQKTILDTPLTSNITDIKPFAITIANKQPLAIISSVSQSQKNVNHLSDTSQIIEMLKESQEKMELLQKENREQMELQQKESLEKMELLQKRLDDIEKKPVNTVINNTNSNNNIINNNLTFNIYFTADLDLYQTISESKGEKFAQNHIFNSMHNHSYLDLIRDFVVNIDVDKSPIRLGRDGVMIIHRSDGVAERDPDGDLLEKDTKNIAINDSLKAFNRTDDNVKLEEISVKNNRVNELNNISIRHCLSYEQKKELKDCQDYVDEAYGEMLDGTGSRPQRAKFNDNLTKITKSKISDKSLKIFKKNLPPEFRSVEH